MSVRATMHRWIIGVVVVALGAALLTALPAMTAPTGSAAAATGSDFDAGNIIDDAVFYDSNALDAGSIQSFLDARVSRCSSTATCLKAYRQSTDNRPADRYCSGYAGQANESAAQIIDKVARSCGVSQKVLLVLLEKEQSLVTSTAPSSWSYSAATGQGCPDTAACDATTAGFFYQVYYAARQYQIYRLNPNSWGYQAGRWNTILFNPNRGCGTKSVYIENQATAGLYIYTPYTPNTAALDNLYGTGDGCSSYGNRNFWRLFTDWFGSTHPPRNPDGPFGNVESVTAVPGGFSVTGWAADPNTTEPIAVHVYVGSVGTAVTANGDRPDVAAVYPAIGARHGFSLTVPATTEGANTVCVYGINVGVGGNSQLKCIAVTAMAGPPFGAVESVVGGEGSVTVSGWAIDPDTAAPAVVHVYVDDRGTAITADSPRNDVAGIYPAYGSAHGFGRTISADPGSHTVCVYGINVGVGGNVQLGCSTVSVTAPSDSGRVPVGLLEGVSAEGTTVTAAGWSLDPDTSLPISVRVEAAGKSTVVTADSPRPDVASAYPGYGANHGFSAQLTLPPGTTSVCAYGVNTGRGGDGKIGCRSVTVTLPDLRRAPVGVIDAVTVRGNSASVSGWAVDEDTADPIAVHIYVGSKGAAYVANKSRPDIGALYPVLGDKHGFGESVTVPTGRSTICVYGINNGDGGNTLLGCRDVVAADHSAAPFGQLESVAPTSAGVAVSGWAIDPDTVDAIPVHVYVDGVGVATTADVRRDDVAQAYAGVGARHGFGVVAPASPGAHTVCVYAINDGEGGNTLLDCRAVAVP